MNKTFPLRTILTVTTGRLLAKRKSDSDNGIGDLYELLDHMIGESPYTHSLRRFSEECKPVLMEMCPELGNADLDDLDKLLEQPGGVNIWFAKCKSDWGMPSELSIPRDCVRNHESKDPVTELGKMLK